MIHLAYDGSINGDWLAWYALNMARRDPEHRLNLLHVDTDEIRMDVVRTRAASLKRECMEAGVEMMLDILPSSGPSSEQVFRDLLARVPGTPDTLLLCGMRLEGRLGGYLSGTVSERLLSDRTFDVMAVRVVQPGLLGAPKRFLLPVAGDPEGFRTAAQIIRRFGPDVARIQLLRVMMVRRPRYRRLRNDQAAGLRKQGWEGIRGLSEQLADSTGVEGWKVDANVTISDDWAHEVIIAANRYKSHMVLMEAGWKNLRTRFLYGNPLEVVLRDAPCDVGIFRGV